MKILQKIFIPIVIFTLLFSNIGFNIVKHTCGTSGDVNISLYFEEVCSDDKCIEVKEVKSTDTHCCDAEVANKMNSEVNSDIKSEVKAEIKHNTNIAEINCCSNESKVINSIIEFTISTTPNYNFETNVVIAESFNYKVTQLNQDYELLIENINNKIKDFGKNILKFLIQQLQNSSSDNEGNTI